MSRAPSTRPAPPASGATEQQRVLRVLVLAQILSGAGLAAGISVGALLAQEMLGSTGLAGLPISLFTAGSALAAVAVGRISQRHGRRPGLAAGYAVGALGSVGVVVAAALDTPFLLFVSLFVYGSGTATTLQARYAGADLADPARRGRAVSTVLVATTFGGVIGPNLGDIAGGPAEALGLPRLAGPFLLAAAAYTAAALVLFVRLRPDPLLLARARSAAPSGSGGGPPADAPPARPGGLVMGAGTMVLTQLVMVAVMTMTPVYMHDHGHTTAVSSLVIAVHVGAMYLPSPLTGLLVDRLGRLPMAVASGVTLLGAGVLAAAAPPTSVPLITVALALLGLGWNFGLVSGTALITDNAPPATRARTQSLVDVALALAGSTGGLVAGVVVAASGYPMLTLTAGVLSLTVLPAVATVVLRASRTPGADGAGSGREADRQPPAAGTVPSRPGPSRP